MNEDQDLERDGRKEPMKAGPPDDRPKQGFCILLV